MSFIIMALIPPWGSTFMTYCCCCCSVTKSILCDPMDCSTPGLPVTHHLPEFGQVHAHWVGDAIKPSHPLKPSSLSALNLSQHQRLFQRVSCLHQVTKILELHLQHQSFQWYSGLISLKTDWCDLLAVQGDSRESSPAPQFEGINTLTLCLLLCLRVLEIILSF